MAALHTRRPLIGEHHGKFVLVKGQVWLLLHKLCRADLAELDKGIRRVGRGRHLSLSLWLSGSLNISLLRWSRIIGSGWSLRFTRSSWISYLMSLVA
jgi:hypothetical protein